MCDKVFELVDLFFLPLSKKELLAKDIVHELKRSRDCVLLILMYFRLNGFCNSTFLTGAFPTTFFEGPM